MIEDTRALYSFLVQVTTNEHDLVNNFGYRRDEDFRENITRKVMVALADYPHLVNVNVTAIPVDSPENEEYEEDDE